MTITSSATIALGAFAVAVTLGATVPPAEAGRACNELGLSSPCIRSNDLKARINLDEDGRDGRLRVRDADGENAVELDGSSANVTNLFSNLEDESNGLVKAWARINANGTIDACWRCNTDPNETQRLGAGEYEVDFTPLATDITGRPRSATIDAGPDVAPVTIVTLEDRFNDPSSVFVDATNLADVLTDSPFVLIIY